MSGRRGRDGHLEAQAGGVDEDSWTDAVMSEVGR